MVAACREYDVQWRPHAKCHKSPIIGRWLVDAGACGLTCATLREAEIMAAAGISDLLIANLIAGSAKIARLVELAARADLIICVDHSTHVETISAAMAEAHRTVRVLIELEIGMHRVGVNSPNEILRLARLAHAAPGLELAGVMAYEGHLLTIPDTAEKERAIHDALDKAVSARRTFESHGLPCPIVSCGGTGSYPIALRKEGITEIQAGGAIFMDVFYRQACQIEGLQNALTLLATIGSLPASNRAVIDAGRKAMNIEIARPELIGLPGVTIESLSAEHGLLQVADGAPPLQIGQLVELIPGYADLTNVLHPCFYAFRAGKFELEIPIVR
jgi:D-serine deaminase-like pyridoxal phosphate-dependent protein